MQYCSVADDHGRQNVPTKASNSHMRGGRLLVLILAIKSSDGPQSACQKCPRICGPKSEEVGRRTQIVEASLLVFDGVHGDVFPLAHHDVHSFGPHISQSLHSHSPRILDSPDMQDRRRLRRGAEDMGHDEPWLGSQTTSRLASLTIVPMRLQPTGHARARAR